MMARSRNIKPGFFKNDRLAECGPVAMIVFAGLWCIADYRGNLEYRPKRIKIDTIPYFEESIEECIEVLSRHGFVELYEVNDTAYLHIVGFEKHQNPHKNERHAGTSIPSIEEAGINTERAPDDSQSDRADSLNLIPDSLDTVKPVSIPVSRSKIPFSEFWELYPRKTNKTKAEAAWKKLKATPETFAAIQENINARLRAGEWSLERKEFIPHASTYLNNARWEDEIIAEPSDPHEISFDLEAVAR